MVGPAPILGSGMVVAPAPSLGSGDDSNPANSDPATPIGALPTGTLPVEGPASFLSAGDAGRQGVGLGVDAGLAYFDAGLAYVVMVNQTAKHALPVALNTANNALLDVLLAQAGRPQRSLLHVSTHPFPAVGTEQEVCPAATACSACRVCASDTEQEVCRSAAACSACLVCACKGH